MYESATTEAARSMDLVDNGDGPQANGCNDWSVDNGDGPRANGCNDWSVEYSV
jgi:hypothetical protein